MSIKLFSRQEIFKTDDEDIKLETPWVYPFSRAGDELDRYVASMLGEIDDTKERIFALESLAVCLEQHRGIHGLSPTAASIALVAINFQTQGKVSNLNIPALEDFYGDNNTIATSYAIEGINLAVKMLFSDMVTKIEDKFSGKYDRWKRFWSGMDSIRGQSEAILYRLEKFTDEKKDPHIDVEEGRLWYIPKAEPSAGEANIEKARSLLRNHTVMGAGVNVYIELLNLIKGIRTGSLEELDKSTADFMEDQPALFRKIMENKGFEKNEEYSDETNHFYQLFLDEYQNFHSAVWLRFTKAGVLNQVSPHDRGIFWMQGEDYDAMLKNSDMEKISKSLEKHEIQSLLESNMGLTDLAYKTERSFGKEKQLVKEFLREVKRVDNGLKKMVRYGEPSANEKRVRNFITAAPTFVTLLFKPMDDLMVYIDKLSREVNGFCQDNMFNLKRQTKKDSY